MSALHSRLPDTGSLAQAFIRVPKQLVWRPEAKLDL